MTGLASTTNSSSFHYHWTYDVFISFRGEDTRYGFTGNLNHALTQKGVRTFFDDKEIRKGDEITPKLLKAIKESRMAIIVFSENYASSTFCLDELVQICQCIKHKDRLVWPIFYNVEPSEVRHQKEKYGQALAMHTNNLRASEEKIQSWKLALYEVSNISGTHFNTRHDYEYQVVERIVEDIFRIINRALLHIAEYPVGLDSRLQNINSLLQLELKDKVIMVGICGMGGVGKTTIARALYNSVADNFEGLCFLYDIKENQKKIGLEQMQERMLSKILGVDIKIDDVNEGIAIIKERLKQKKILLILDNVYEHEQLRKFAGRCDWFGPGSRIVITTRDKRLLVRHGIESTYDMEAFNYEESLELLCWNAFKTMQVDPSYKEVVDSVICYAQGLPLALEVVGSHLCGMRIREWESALSVYERIPHEDIQNILKTSYDSLTQVEKEIFLDIACFFKGNELKYVEDMVKHAHGFDPLYAIQVLVDKCLIKIEKDWFSYKFNCIEMHDLIQNMGREIVRQESPYEAGKRSRLWFPQDIIDIFEENTGTDEVRSIIVQDKSQECIEINWDGEAFKNMKNLKILILENVIFSASAKYLPNSLRVLKWKQYPGSFLPHNFCPKKLVVIDLAHSSLNSLETIKNIESLSVLNLGGCKYIKQIPDLSHLFHLRELYLQSCEGLIEIHDSVGYLTKLVTLSAYGCAQLKTFPRAIKLPSLMNLQLSNCPNLKYFPEILNEMKTMTYLDLSATGIEKLPWSICNLASLQRLTVRGIELPQSIFLLRSLEKLTAESCEKFVSMKESREEVKKGRIFAFNSTIVLRKCNISDEDLPFILTKFKVVKILDLSGNNFTTLPACIKCCFFLLRLILNNCKLLIQVEGIPLRIKHLEALGCTSLSSESRNLLLTEELLRSALTNTEDCVFFNSPDIVYGISSGSSINIPEWFHHQCRGSSISFWFRNDFPTASLCSVFRSTKYVFTGPEDCGVISLREDYMEAVVLINDRKVTKRRWHKAAPNEDVMVVCDVRLDDPRSDEYHKMKYACGRENYEWNHVKIVYQPKSEYYAIDKIGVYLLTHDRSMEDIRFTDPYERFNSSYLLTHDGSMEDIRFTDPYERFNSRNLDQDFEDSVLSGNGK